MVERGKKPNKGSNGTSNGDTKLICLFGECMQVLWNLLSASTHREIWL